MAEYNPNDYVPERDVWQQWSDRLGSLGMTLIGAGQKITPQQRAQIFSEGAKYMQTNNTGMLNAAQARLYNMQAKDKFDDKQRAEKAREMLRGLNLTGQDAVLADLDPYEYSKLTTQQKIRLAELRQAQDYTLAAQAQNHGFRTTEIGMQHDNALKQGVQNHDFRKAELGMQFDNTLKSNAQNHDFRKAELGIANDYATGRDEKNHAFRLVELMKQNQYRPKTLAEMQNAALDDAGVKGPARLSYLFPENMRFNALNNAVSGLPADPDATPAAPQQGAAGAIPLGPNTPPSVAASVAVPPNVGGGAPAQPQTNPFRASSAFGMGSAINRITALPYQAAIGESLEGNTKAVDDAKAYVDRLNTKIMGAMAENVQGRPTNYTIKTQKELLPDTTSPLMTPDMALKRYEYILQDLKRQYLEHHASMTGNAGSGNGGEALRQKARADDILNTYREVQKFTERLKTELGKNGSPFRVEGNTIIAPNGARITPAGQ